MNLINKCRLCYQINNNLNNLYNNGLKYLAQMILKLKGFEDSVDVSQSLVICYKCNQGLENLATFWDSIPDAKSKKTTNSGQLEEIGEQKQAFSSNAELSSVLNQNLPPIIITNEKQNECKSKNIETNCKRITRRTKIPRERKRPVEKSCTADTGETHQKRIRRRPKRYDDFTINSPNKSVQCTSVDAILNESSLNEFTQMAVLRSSDGQDIGKLVEDKKEGISSRMRIICQFCFEVFRIEKKFKTHLKSHDKNLLEAGEVPSKCYLFYCKLCDKSFPEHFRIRRHFKYTHSKERSLKCRHCDAVFKHKFNLDYHLAKHESKKRFECSFCKKKFLMRYELQIHIRTHTKERPYKCAMCSFSCSHRSNLKVHQKVKHCWKTTNQTTANMTENAICEENFEIFSFNPPQILLEKEEDTQLVSNVENANKSPHLSTCEHLICDLRNENVEMNSRENECSSEHNAETATRLISTNDSKNLKLLETHETYKESHEAEPKLGTFQLDSRILKVLPTPTLLGLKKWHKSFQSTSITTFDWPGSSTFSDNANSNPIQIEEITSYNSKQQVNYSLCDKAAQNCSQCLEPDNMPNNLKSIIIYKPSQTNSQQITNNNFYNILTSPQPAEISNSSTKNVEVSNGIIPTNGCKIINISKIMKSSIGLDQVETKFETAEKSKNDSLKTNNFKPWKAVVSAKPVKIKDILNLKTSSTNSSTSNNNNVANIADDKNPTEICPNFKQVFAIPQQTNKNCITNIPASCSSSTPNLKYTNISKQSLLKPIIKSQQISTLSLINPRISQTVLPERPVITSMEYLTPLEPMNASPINLIKPPKEYKYQCPYCYKYFKQRSPLTKHIRTHTNEKPYKCNLCPKSYTDASNYKKHKMLHKNAAEALNISRTANAVPNSPAYSTVSDPDPDGVEVMQTIQKFERSSSDEDDVFDDDASLSSSTMESRMWQDALENALNNDEIRENIKRNLQGINNAILPKCMQQIANTTDLNISFSTEGPD